MPLLGQQVGALGHPFLVRLFGHVDGADAFSAARWAADARAEIAAIHAAERLPILVGGTGLYIRTLLDGIAPVPEIDPAVRARVRALPVAAAHAALASEDAAAAARLSTNDTARVARALEVIREHGGTVLDGPQDSPFGRVTTVLDPAGATFQINEPPAEG